jgi:2-methylcitrate dehydratase PrpD
MSSVEPLAAHVARLTYADLPAAVVRAAKIFILDTFSCALAGSTGPSSAETLAAARNWGAGDAAAVWARADRLPAPSAALVNAYQIHCLEFDCVHEGGVLHPMSSLMSALLADIEGQGRKRDRKVSGRDFIAAIAAGIDTSCSIAVCSKAPMRFFRPAAVGGFGAAAACAKLRGFDKDGIWNALGVMYGQTSGTMQAHVEGSKLLGLQVGFAARSAVVACDLAEAGIDGPKDVISGQWGYLPLFEGEYDLEPAWSQFGKTWRLLEVGHKPFPSGRLTHYAVDALQQMQKAHGFAAADVAKVTIVCPPLPHRLVGRPDKRDCTPNYAKLCLGFVCARTLIKGTVDQFDFVETVLRDEATHALAERVEVILDSNPDMNAFGPQDIKLSLRDGRSFAMTVAKAIGDPANPLPRDRQVEKFWKCWDLAASKMPRRNGEALLARIDTLETVDDVADLVRLVTPG